MHKPVRVLFLCDGNADRSQMAEGLLRKLGGNNFDAHSAGLEPKALDPLAIKAMQEINIDISGHRSKHLNEYMDNKFDYVITLCDSVKSSCLSFLHDGKNLHWQCADPSEIKGTHEERLVAYRHARDELKQKLELWISALRYS